MRNAPVYLLYVITGTFGLIYEVVWSRYLGLLMGNTAQAHAVVLATFMGGLALGAFAFGRIADRVPQGLRLYGWIEVGVGLHAVFFPRSSRPSPRSSIPSPAPPARAPPP
ncbi:MAG: hypothetical protein R3F43_00720 [bacterium]